jgi:rRNA maturation RNase YbeY
MIQYISESSFKFPFKKREITKWIKDIAQSKHFICGDISYVFVSSERIVQVNVEYLQHDYPTDIITFDYTADNIISGDIFICPDVVKSNAQDFKVSFEEELKRVIIHGILHLCGVADKSLEEEMNMHSEEDTALLIFNK